MGPVASDEEYGTLLDKLKPAAKEEPKKPRALKDTVAAAPETPAPAEAEPSAYERSLMDLKTERATAKTERDAALRRAEIGELASIIGQSLTQIGAAASGMRSGADMSGIAQKALVDWDKRKDQVMSLYKQNVAELDSQQDKLERAKERAEDKAEKEAYQREQMKLAREKLAQDKEIANQSNQLKMLSSIATKNEDAIKASEAQYLRELEELDKQEANFQKIEGLELEGKDKKVIARQVATILGKEAAQKEGWFGGQTTMSKDELMEVVANKRTELQQQRELVKKNLATITAYRARANSPAPAAAPVAPALAAPAGQDAQIVNYAKQNNLDYNRAKDILVKRGYTPKE